MDLIEDDKIFLPFSQYLNTLLNVGDFENKDDALNFKMRYC